MSCVCGHPIEDHDNGPCEFVGKGPACLCVMFEDNDDGKHTQDCARCKKEFDSDGGYYCKSCKKIQNLENADEYDRKWGAENL
jgi:hypothetical protein